MSYDKIQVPAEGGKISMLEYGHLSARTTPLRILSLTLKNRRWTLQFAKNWQILSRAANQKAGHLLISKAMLIALTQQNCCGGVGSQKRRKLYLLANS